MNQQDDTTTQSTTSERILLFRGTDWYRDLSPDEIQTTMSLWYAWFDRLVKEGKLKGGQPLTDEGKVVSGKKGQTVADGPFAESKEAIGGYFLLRSCSLNEALAIAQQCPALDHGMSVEVRTVASICAPGKAAGHHLAEAVT